jgi:hypothetical protein
MKLGEIEMVRVVALLTFINKRRMVYLQQQYLTDVTSRQSRRSNTDQGDVPRGLVWNDWFIIASWPDLPCWKVAFGGLPFSWVFLPVSWSGGSKGLHPYPRMSFCVALITC